MNRTAKAPLGASLVVVSSFFYASYGIWTKLMGNFFDGFTAAVLRGVLVLLLLLPIAIKYGKLEPLRLRQNWRWMAAMLVSSLLVWGPLYFAILQAGVGTSVSVNYASIVIGMFVFGWLFAGERFTKDKAISAALGMAGLACIFAPTVHHVGWMALLGALVSGLSTAANNVFGKRIHYEATQATIVGWMMAAAANFLMAVAFRKPWPSLGWHAAWLYLVVFAVISIVSSWTFIRGVKLIDAGAAGILGLMEIVFGVLFGVVFFGERPGALMLVGVLTIIAAAAIPYLRDYNARRGTLE